MLRDNHLWLLKDLLTLPAPAKEEIDIEGPIWTAIASRSLECR